MTYEKVIIGQGLHNNEFGKRVKTAIRTPELLVELLSIRRTD